MDYTKHAKTRNLSLSLSRSLKEQVSIRQEFSSTRTTTTKEFQSLRKALSIGNLSPPQTSGLEGEKKTERE
jgi:hypothetical protein